MCADCKVAMTYTGLGQALRRAEGECQMTWQSDTVGKSVMTKLCVCVQM